MVFHSARRPFEPDPVNAGVGTVILRWSSPEMGEMYAATALS